VASSHVRLGGFFSLGLFQGFRAENRGLLRCDWPVLHRSHLPRVWRSHGATSNVSQPSVRHTCVLSR
jgi:hypothetical protein